MIFTRASVFATFIWAISTAFFTTGCGGGGSSSADSVTYFLVAERGALTHGDSYILPLADPRDIEMARAIIAGTQPAKIVVAKIMPGSSAGAYTNKDLIGKRTWNWHIVAFEGFADNTIEILDGWPGYVDANLDEWIRITGGRIGFWDYTVKREVPPTEMH